VVGWRNKIERHWDWNWIRKHRTGLRTYLLQMTSRSLIVEVL